MIRLVHLENARRLCAELRMFGSPTRGEHLGAKQSGTILWERDGWPAVEAKIAEALELASSAESARIDELEGALRVAEVAFDCLDPANHSQTSDAELAQLITTARQTVSDAITGKA